MLPSNVECAGTCQSTYILSEGSCLSAVGALHECICSLCSVAQPHFGSQVNTATATWILTMHAHAIACQSLTPKLTNLWAQVSSRH